MVFGGGKTMGAGVSLKYILRKGVMLLSKKYFWLQQEPKESQCEFVRPSGSSLSRAVNLHLSSSNL